MSLELCKKLVPMESFWLHESTHNSKPRPYLKLFRSVLTRSHTPSNANHSRVSWSRFSSLILDDRAASKQDDSLSRGGFSPRVFSEISFSGLSVNLSADPYRTEIENAGCGQLLFDEAQRHKQKVYCGIKINLFFERGSCFSELWDSCGDCSWFLCPWPSFGSRKCEIFLDIFKNESCRLCWLSANLLTIICCSKVR